MINRHRRALFVLGASLGLAAFGVGCTKRASQDPPNTLRLASPAKIKGLDPIYADDLYSHVEVGRVYEGLLQYHYLKRPYVLEPMLAEAMPTIADGGKTLTFKLKRGVLFQDDPSFVETKGKGRELIADDVVYSFKRLANPKLVSPGFWVFDGKILGLNEWRDAQAKTETVNYAQDVAGLKVVDRYTVQIRLTQPSAQFLYVLAMAFTAIVPHEAAEHYGKEFLNHPVGTGPFRLEEFNGSSRVVWVRNPTFRKEVYPSEGEAGDQEKGLLADAGKPLPLADKLVVQIIEESSTMFLSFLSGKLDLSGIPKDNFDQAMAVGKELSPELKQKGIRLETHPLLDITHLSFNMKDPIFGKNKLLRQALSLAYDQAQFNKLFYNDRALVAQGPIPPGVSGYDPAFRNPYREFNIAKAKELLAKAGFPNGEGLPSLELATMSDTTHRQMTDFIERSFQPLGVKIRAMTYSWPEFQSAIKNGRGQVWAFAWSADYPDAENFLQLFYSKNGPPGPNDSAYANPEFDRLYEKALKLPDNAERTALYQQMAKIVVEDCPWIFEAHRLGYGLMQPWLKNYKYHDFEGSRVKYLRVDPSLKR